MPVDYLSAINTRGSGLNVTQIVDSLVNAETEPDRLSIQTKIDTKNLEISTLAEVALEISELKNGVSSFANKTKLSTSSANSTANLSINNPSIAKSFNSDVKVTQLATSQTLEFSGFSSLTSTTGTGSISIDFGAWITNGATTDNDSLFSSKSVSANTSLGTPTSHNVLGGTISIATAVGGDQSSTVFTVTGTDMAGNTLTENITGGASGVTVSGNSVFKTVTSIIPGSTVGSGNVTIGHTASTFGLNSSKNTSTVTVSSGSNNTLSGLATSLNAITGVSANAINKGDGTYSLVVRSEQGYANALRLTVSEAAGDTGLSSFSNVSDNNTHQTTAALNSSILVDGVNIERNSNSINDLFDGYTLDITSVTTSSFRLSSSLDKVSALDTMKDFLDVVNSTRSKLNEWTRIGSQTTEAGPLAKNIGVNNLKKGITSLVTGPIVGFGSDSLYLSQLGVRTSQNGELSVNERTFNTQIENNSTIFDSIFNSLFSSSSDYIKAELSVPGSTNLPKPGSYSFASSNATTATLDGLSMTAGTDTLGNAILTSTSDGDTRGIRITQSQTVSSAIIYFGESLVDSLSKFLENTTSSSGILTKSKLNANNLVTEYNADLLSVDEKVETLKLRYNAQFGAMETAVTSLKSTGEYLTNMMDSWNKE